MEKDNGRTPPRWGELHHTGQLTKGSEMDPVGSSENLLGKSDEKVMTCPTAQKTEMVKTLYRAKYNVSDTFGVPLPSQFLRLKSGLWEKEQLLELYFSVRTWTVA